jgi:DNA-binding response OmpR family regulator
MPGVLIAEGDEEVRVRLQTAMTEAGIDVHSAATTEEAAGHLRSGRYGVAIIDLDLPPGDIERVVETVAALSESARPVVLVLADQRTSLRAMDIDIVQIVLRRPVKLRQLVDVVASCLRSSEGRQPPPEQAGRAQLSS